jgi:vitamin B12 transporter
MHFKTPIVLLFTALFAQAELATLEEVSLTAFRGITPKSQWASTVEVRNQDFIERAGGIPLEAILQEFPGLTVVSTGAPGGLTSLFVRGAPSNQFVLRVDGVRVNDANVAYAPFLGSLSSRGVGRVELIKGPQSSLFGGSAVGGVLSIDAPQAGDDFARVWGGLGNFGSVHGGAEGRTQQENWNVYGILDAERTDNERDFNTFEQVSAVAAVTWDDGALWRVRGVFRGVDNRYEEPGILASKGNPSPGVSELTQALSSLTVDFRPDSDWSLTTILGFQDQDISFSETSFPSQSTHRRFSGEALLRWESFAGQQLLFGLEGEQGRSTGFNSGTERQVSAFAQSEISLGEERFVSGSLRHASYRTFGQNTTGRMTFVEGFSGVGGKFRATLGTGFQPPSLSDRFGSAFTRANPDIKPERSTGLDIGWDQIFFDRRALLRVTWFQNWIRDLIIFESAPFPAQGRLVNADRARTEGVEVSLDASLTSNLTLRSGYTWLEATNRDTDARLVRRPRHSGSAGVIWVSEEEAFSGGLHLRYVADRVDSDFSTFPSRTVNPGAFWDARLNASWQASESFRLDLRVENLLNQRYEEVFGYPARGLSGLISANWSFGR